MMGSSGITTGLLDLIPPKSHGTTKLSMELEKKESSADKRGEMDPRGQNFHLSTDEANDVIVNDAEEANATGRTESPLCDDENNGEATTAVGDEAEMADVSLAETKQSDGSASVAPPVPSEATLEQQHEISAIVEQVMDPWADAFMSNEEASNEITTADNETKAPRAGMPELSAPVVVVVDVPPAEENEQCSSHSSAEKDVLLVELQSSLQDHMLRQAEAEDRARRAKERLAVLEKELRSKVNVEEELKVLKVSMMAVVSDKGHLELELAKLRMARDDHERKEIVLSNRLNAAKKKESVKANLAEQFQEEARELGAELATTQEKLKNTQDALEKSERELRKTREDVAKRVNVAETALSEERRLNDDRKRKMKVFVETKQEEIRLGKVQTDELTAELEQTNRLLREQTGRWKQLHAQWVQSQTRNRELQRDLNRIKKDSDDMHKIGDKMEMKLSRSAQETEEHKNKRLTAKHELMTVLRTLEGEREVSSKLRDSLKFTFTPKALSQQQLLKESLQEFETELQNLSRRLGKPYLPPTDSVNLFSTDDTLDSQADGVALASNDDDADNDAESVLMKNRSAIDSTHLISNLENETQRVSQCIMALTSSIERMHALLHVNGTQTCFTALTGLLTGSSSGSATTTSNGSSLSHDVRAGGRAPVVRARSTRYGQLPTDPN
jgi:myosin heavy subunit